MNETNRPCCLCGRSTRLPIAHSFLKGVICYDCECQQCDLNEEQHRKERSRAERKRSKWERD